MSLDKIIFSLSENYKIWKDESNIININEETDDYIIIKFYDGKIKKLNKKDIDIINQ
jgi:hypothetical protein